MNDPATMDVRPGPVRSGSAAGSTPRLDEHQSDPPDGPPTNPVAAEADRAAEPGLFDWVPAALPDRAQRLDYPIEGGVPHPHWLREASEHRLAAHPVVIRESAAVVRLLVALAVAAFLLGMMVFYPVSPLGH